MLVCAARGGRRGWAGGGGDNQQRRAPARKSTMGAMIDRRARWCDAWDTCHYQPLRPPPPALRPQPPPPPPSSCSGCCAHTASLPPQLTSTLRSPPLLATSKLPARSWTSLTAPCRSPSAFPPRPLLRRAPPNALATRTTTTTRPPPRSAASALSTVNSPWPLDTPNAPRAAQPRRQPTVRSTASAFNATAARSSK